MENLLIAWEEFLVGKKNKSDVQEFSLQLSDNIFSLHEGLVQGKYVHGKYQAFRINDPKPRDIHKAKVRDRLLHHAIHRKLSLEFERFFIADSFSCRVDKGVHRALNRFRVFGGKVSKNNTKTCWVLKCDIKKCFASIDHDVLLHILYGRIVDKNIVNLLEKIIRSFHSEIQGKGIPLGNLTSQLLVNICMNEFDQFMKHKIKARYYMRYADDFVILSQGKQELVSLLPQIKSFLFKELKLELHPKKVSIQTLASGVDLLGWVHFPDHRVLRTATKKRMFRNIASSGGKEETVASYLGMLGHGNAYGLKREVKRMTNKKGSEAY